MRCFCQRVGYILDPSPSIHNHTYSLWAQACWFLFGPGRRPSHSCLLSLAYTLLVLTEPTTIVFLCLPCFSSPDSTLVSLPERSSLMASLGEVFQAFLLTVHHLILFLPISSFLKRSHFSICVVVCFLICPLESYLLEGTEIIGLVRADDRFWKHLIIFVEWFNESMGEWKLRSLTSVSYNRMRETCMNEHGQISKTHEGTDI